MATRNLLQAWWQQGGTGGTPPSMAGYPGLDALKSKSNQPDFNAAWFQQENIPYQYQQTADGGDRISNPQNTYGTTMPGTMSYDPKRAPSAATLALGGADAAMAGAASGAAPLENTRIGFTWDPQRGWVNPQKVARGTYLAPGVGLPVDYDPSQDAQRWGVNGTKEGAMQRAVRRARDMVRDGVTQNFQNALAFEMANLSSDYQRTGGDTSRGWIGGGLGWDPAKFRYNDFGERYNDQIDYANPTKTAAGGGTANAAAGANAGSTVTSGAGQQGGTNVSVGLDPMGGATAAAAAAENARRLNGGGGNTRGGGVFPESAITHAAADPTFAYNLYRMQRNGGKLPTGVGPWDSFMKSYLQPAIGAAINALANANGGRLPSNINDLFDQIDTASGSNGLFDFFRGLGQRGVAGAMGTVGNNFPLLSDLLQASEPLTTFGMNKLGANAAGQSLDDVLAQGAMKDAYDPNQGEGNGFDWNNYFRSSDYMKRYYGGAR